MTKCTIKFPNNPNGVFFAGQILTGNVVLTTVKPKTIRGIYVLITGIAKVRWIEWQNTDSTRYQSSNQYLSSKSYFIGKNGGDSIEFSSGTHIYNFEIQLPVQLPSSFIGKYGQVLYEATVRIDRPFRYDNVFRQPFTVISPLDLNHDPIYKAPLKLNAIKTLCTFYCSSQSVKLHCYIPCGGFCAGQKINFKVIIENESAVNCYRSKAKLEMVTRYTATSPSKKCKYEKLKVAETQLGHVPKRTNKEFENFIQLPALAPSTLQTCDIIEVTYMFILVVYPSGYHRNIKLTFPITIGTFPFRHIETNKRAMVHLPATPQVLPELPSYEQVFPSTGQQFVDKEEDRHATVEPFSPKYPFYPGFAESLVTPAATVSNIKTI